MELFWNWIRQLLCAYCGFWLFLSVLPEHSARNYVRLFGLPGDYSCICSFELLKKAVQASESKKVRYHVGNILSSDMFYSQDLNNGGITWSEMGVLAVEMESAALYSNAAAAGANAISIFTISDSLISGEETTAEEREKSFTDMMEIALDMV